MDDDLAGAALVVDHPVALGHRHMAHTTATVKGGQWTRRPEQVRSEGYRQAMHRHGLDEAVTIAGMSYSEEAGYQAGRELVHRPDRPAAIFAGADFAALGVLRAAHELGLRIPADLSLAGYDNITVAARDPINLTSVDQAAHDIGATAALSNEVSWVLLGGSAVAAAGWSALALSGSFGKPIGRSCASWFAGGWTADGMACPLRA